MQRVVFTWGFLVHLLYGDVKSKSKARAGRVAGFHHEGGAELSAFGVKVVNRSAPAWNGVYLARVEVERRGFRGVKETTCFPRRWTVAQVLEAIREVYERRPLERRYAVWHGWCSRGVYIVLLCNPDGTLRTAYPAWPQVERKTLRDAFITGEPLRRDYLWGGARRDERREQRAGSA